MDLIYRKDQYRKFLSRLEALKGDAMQVGDTLYATKQQKVVSKAIDTILAHLHNRKEYSQYRLIYLILFLPLFVVLVLEIIFHSWMLPCLFIIGIVIFLCATNYRMTDVIERNRSLTDDEIGDDPNEFLRNKISFISSALDIKSCRVQHMMIGWCLFFAPLLVFSYHLIFGVYPFGSIGAGFVVAYVLSVAFWYYYFFESLGEYAQIGYQLDSYLGYLDE